MNDRQPTFLKELRDAAMKCSNIEYREQLHLVVNAVDDAITEVSEWPSTENLKRLNGLWAKAQRILENVPPEGAPAPVSGPSEAPVLQRMVA